MSYSNYPHRSGEAFTSHYEKDPLVGFTRDMAHAFGKVFGGAKNAAQRVGGYDRNKIGSMERAGREKMSLGHRIGGFILKRQTQFEEKTAMREMVKLRNRNPGTWDAVKTAEQCSETIKQYTLEAHDLQQQIKDPANFEQKEKLEAKLQAYQERIDELKTRHVKAVDFINDSGDKYAQARIQSNNVATEARVYGSQQGRNAQKDFLGEKKAESADLKARASMSKMPPEALKQRIKELEADKRAQSRDLAQAGSVEERKQHEAKLKETEKQLGFASEADARNDRIGEAAKTSHAQTEKIKVLQQEKAQFQAAVQNAQTPEEKAQAQKNLDACTISITEAQQTRAGAVSTIAHESKEKNTLASKSEQMEKAVDRLAQTGDHSKFWGDMGAKPDYAPALQEASAKTRETAFAVGLSEKSADDLGKLQETMAKASEGRTLSPAARNRIKAVDEALKNAKVAEANMAENATLKESLAVNKKATQDLRSTNATTSDEQDAVRGKKEDLVKECEGLRGSLKENKNRIKADDEKKADLGNAHGVAKDHENAIKRAAGITVGVEKTRGANAGVDNNFRPPPSGAAGSSNASTSTLSTGPGARNAEQKTEQPTSEQPKAGMDAAGKETPVPNQPITAAQQQPTVTKAASEPLQAQHPEAAKTPRTENPSPSNAAQRAGDVATKIASVARNPLTAAAEAPDKAASTISNAADKIHGAVQGALSEAKHAANATFEKNLTGSSTMSDKAHAGTVIAVSSPEPQRTVSKRDIINSDGTYKPHAGTRVSGAAKRFAKDHDAKLPAQRNTDSAAVSGQQTKGSSASQGKSRK